ncbi:hypothetical protein ACGFX4_38850 [Kitasatospora sp. NPDC048365]|uniref:hypothetical protein n=1 Tax=Kitasatospora sp. NPDC048365 TaxID=3364050 RepID=UPI0037125A25
MRTIRITAGIVILTALTSCGLTSEQLKPTITKAQATQQVTSYDTEIVTSLVGTAKEAVPVFQSMECETADIPGPKGRVSVSSDDRAFRTIPKERNAEIVQAFETKLTSLGFELYRKSGNDRVYKNKSNGFTVVLREGLDDRRTLTLTVDSGCVWPDGTPPAR